jgi:hypothetical protein
MASSPFVMRTSARAKLSWFLLMVVLVVYLVVAFVRLGRLHTGLSKREMFLGVALLIVWLVGILVKRQKRS